MHMYHHTRSPCRSPLVLPPFAFPLFRPTPHANQSNPTPPITLTEVPSRLTCMDRPRAGVRTGPLERNPTSLERLVDSAAVGAAKGEAKSWREHLQDGGDLPPWMPLTGHAHTAARLPTDGRTDLMIHLTPKQAAGADPSRAGEASTPSAIGGGAHRFVVRVRCQHPHTISYISLEGGAFVGRAGRRPGGVRHGLPEMQERAAQHYGAAAAEGAVGGVGKGALRCGREPLLAVGG